MITNLKNKKGIWLLEILISVTIMALVAATVALVFNRSLHFYRQASDKNEASQDAQISTEWLVRDLDNATCLSQKNPDSIAMENAAGKIRYHLQNAQSPYALKRSLNSVDYTVSENVDSLNFKYFNVTNQQTSSDIRQVEITLATVSGDQKFSLYTTAPVDVIPGSGLATAYGGTPAQTGNDIINCVIPTLDGGFILGGSSSNFGGMTDFLVIKLRPDRTVEWARTYGGNNVDELYTIQEVAGGGYILGGSAQNLGLAGADFLFIRTDTMGRVGGVFPGTWAKTYGSSGHDWFSACTQLAGGGFILGGDGPSFLNSDISLIRIDNSGNWVWGKRYSGPGGDELYFLRETSDGLNFLLGGQSFSWGTQDGLLIKTNTNGEVGSGFLGTWVRTYGGSDTDFFTSLLEANSPPGYVVGGFSNSFGAGNFDATLFKIDNNGNLGAAGTWTISYGGSAADYLRAFQPITNGYIIGGDTWSFDAGRPDFLLMKVDAAGGVVWAKRYGGANDEVVNSLAQTPVEYMLGGYTTSFGSNNGDIRFFTLITDLEGTLSCCANMDAHDVVPTIGNPRAEPDWNVYDPIAGLPGSGWDSVSLIHWPDPGWTWIDMDATTRPGWHTIDKTAVVSVTPVCQ